MKSSSVGGAMRSFLRTTTSASASATAGAAAGSARAISTRVAGIGNNVFAEISQLAAQHGAVNLGQGFPSFHTPDFVKQAAIDAINANNNQYTRPGGQADYVNVLADMYSPLFKRELDPMTNIVTFNGAQEGIAAIMASLLEPGDEVVTFEPYFDAYKTVSTLLGIKTVGIPFELSPEKMREFQRSDTSATFSSQDFRIDLEKLDRLITENTKMIVLNTPHNPTGKVLSKHELEQIAQVLKKHPHVLILSDEVYEFMAYDGLAHERIGSFPGMFDRTISLFSAGKTFSCTGWRVGYAVAPAHLTGAITKAHSTVPFCGTTPFEVAMASCFKQAQTNGYLDELKATLEAKRDRIVEALTDANWRPIVPEGGYFVCCDVSHLPIFQEFAGIEITSELPKPVSSADEERSMASGYRGILTAYFSLFVCLRLLQQYPDYQFAYKLCKEHKLAVIPTSPFFSRPEHQLAPGVVRLAYCKDDKTLDDAIRVISSFKQ